MIDSMDKCDECNAVMYNGDYICCHACHMGTIADFKDDISKYEDVITDLNSELAEALDSLSLLEQELKAYQDKE